MKTIWKVLLGAAAVAAVTPYRVQKDQETGVVKLRAATWKATYTPATDEHEKHLDVLLSAFNRHDEDEEEDTCCCGEERESDEGITVEVEVEKTPEPAPEAPQDPQEA